MENEAETGQMKQNQQILLKNPWKVAEMEIDSTKIDILIS